MKELMTGNEAIARGAYEAGVHFASAYPGTPSTEILENIVQYKKDLYAEWAPNEKVAFESAVGASIAGARALATMKHVGVNVAADPLFTFAYTGVTGGFVFVSADDPGMHSSQNEQDNRNYATFSRTLMLEPSNSQEAKDFTILAYELSERFNTPVMLRVTTRVCHSKSPVELSDRKEVEVVPYQKNIEKYVATPANGKVLRRKLVDRLVAMEEYSNQTEINTAEYNGNEVGVISAGVAYQYAREVFGDDASYLKLGMTYPLPIAKIKEFAGKVKKLYVIEEMDPYMENQIKLAGIPCIGKEVIPEMDELNPDVIRQAVFGIKPEAVTVDAKAVGRPPVMCAGCPHRGFFYTLSNKKNVMITGDIGCYTLGSAPPLSAMDTCICMGGSISTGHGASKVLKNAGMDRKVVSVIGDSTFFHTGINSLMNVAYNDGSNVTVILDNRITGMTGHQDNPGTGYTLMGGTAVEADIPAVCKAIGIKEENIFQVNPLDLRSMMKTLNEALKRQTATVIIAKWPCVLKKFTKQDLAEFDLNRKKSTVDQNKCVKCRACVKTGCPAIYNGDEITIDQLTCVGCSLCRQVCPVDAILEVIE